MSISSRKRLARFPRPLASSASSHAVSSAIRSALSWPLIYSLPLFVVTLDCLP